MKVACMIAAIAFLLLAAGAQCQNYDQLVAPSMERANPSPWSTIPKRERAFGLFYYLFLSR